MSDTEVTLNRANNPSGVGNTTIEGDLAYLKGLAEAGRRAPLQTGPYLVAGGTWFAGASAVLAMAQLGVFRLENSAIGWVFAIAAVGFGLTLFSLIRRDGPEGQLGQNRVINSAWSGAGFGIFAFWASCTLMAIRVGDGAIMGTISLAVLAIYGVTWWISGALTGVVWMRTIALLSFASALPVALATNTPFAWLAYTGALVASVLLPGIYLVRIGGRAV